MLAGEICLPENADCDVWRRPGNASWEIMVVEVADTRTDEGCNGEEQTRKACVGRREEVLLR